MQKGKKFFDLFKLKEISDEYEIVGPEIIGRNIEVLHKKCGTIWNCNYHHFVRGGRCPNKNCKDERRVKTNLEKFGVERYIQTKEGKERISKNTSLRKKETHIKSKKTKLKKYGNENYVNPNKAKKTNLEKYGVENVSFVPEFIKKKKKSWENKTEIEKKSQLDGIKINAYKLKKQRYLSFFQNYIEPLFTLEKYEGNKKYYKFKCKKCGSEFNFRIDAGNLPICRKCNPTWTSSNIENKIKSFIDTLNIEYIPNYRDYYNKNKFYEIDIFIPEKNIGIEINGNYWHSELNGKNSSYHKNKKNYFKKKEINLIQFFEDEIIDKYSIIKSMIKSKLGLIQNKIYARNTQVNLVSSKESEKFLDNNHIQGSVSGSIKLGLYYNHHLVSLMILSQHNNRHKIKYDYNLVRFASLKNVSVVGGFSKLLKYFIKNYNPTSIITYADLRYSTGNVYEKNGFQNINISKPSFYYVDRKDYQTRLNRRSFQKHKLKSMFENYDENKTEWENMIENGYDRIWNCGTIAYLFTK